MINAEVSLQSFAIISGLLSLLDVYFEIVSVSSKFSVSYHGNSKEKIFFKISVGKLYDISELIGDSFAICWIY